MKRSNLLTCFFSGLLCLVFFAFLATKMAPTGNGNPVQIPTSTPRFQQLTKMTSLPNATQIYVKEKLGKKAWKIGEGQGNSIEPDFYAAVERHNERTEEYYHFAKVLTPTVLMMGENKDVYGQFLSNETDDFQFGIIKGNDDHFHIVHPTMNQIFAQDYVCYGLPSGDYSAKYCNKCKRNCVYQDFTNCANKTTRLYAYPTCKLGGYHSFFTKTPTYVHACNPSEANTIAAGNY